MNANEVIANLAGDEAHPNDHVNMGQSSNDVFPSAVHLAALEQTSDDLLPAIDALVATLDRKGDEFAEHVKSGRTHLMDAVPVTLGQEFSGFASQIRLGAERIRGTLGRVGQIPLGGTATGTGINTHAEFSDRVREKLTRDSGLEISAPADRFEAQANRDALVELSGALKVLAVSLIKIGNDLALMGSGPRAGLAEIRLPELQKGSSIMPGKVNPVIPEVVIQVGDQVIGNDTAITLGGAQGQFELNVRVPLIARNLLDSIKLLASACRLLDTKCVAGIEPNEEMLPAARRVDPARSRPPSTRTSATTAPPRSSRRPPPPAARSARSRSRRASTRRPSTRRSTSSAWPTRTADAVTSGWRADADRRLGAVAPGVVGGGAVGDPDPIASAALGRRSCSFARKVSPGASCLRPLAAAGAARRAAVPGRRPRAPVAVLAAAVADPDRDPDRVAGPDGPLARP